MCFNNDQKENNVCIDRKIVHEKKFYFFSFSQTENPLNPSKTFVEN